MRLARYLACHQLDAWGFPSDSPLTLNAGLVVTELAANAVLHGHVPGRDFEVALRQPGLLGALRVEVADARWELWPDPGKLSDPGPDGEEGRGLLLIDCLSTAWGVTSRVVGKTVWVELALPADA